MTMIYEKKKRLEHLKEIFENLKPFETEDDIPNIPVVDGEPEFYKEVVVKNLIRCGAIPKSELEIGAWYIGDTRNTDKAMWNGKEFAYERCKWNMWFKDEVNHFEDDNGYALFVPLKKIDKPNDLHLNWD